MTRTPRTYDEITRATVPEPDGSFRATPGQVARSGAEFDAERSREQMTDAERAVHGRVQSIVGGYPTVSVELSGGRVTLRGSVPDAAAIAQLEASVGAVDGVAQVDNQLVAAARP